MSVLFPKVLIIPERSFVVCYLTMKLRFRVFSGGVGVLVSPSGAATSIQLLAWVLKNLGNRRGKQMRGWNVTLVTDRTTRSSCGEDRAELRHVCLTVPKVASQLGRAASRSAGCEATAEAGAVAREHHPGRKPGVQEGLPAHIGCEPLEPGVWQKVLTIRVRT